MCLHITKQPSDLSTAMFISGKKKNCNNTNRNREYRVHKENILDRKFPSLLETLSHHKRHLRYIRQQQENHTECTPVFLTNC